MFVLFALGLLASLQSCARPHWASWKVKTGMTLAESMEAVGKWDYATAYGGAPGQNEMAYSIRQTHLFPQVSGGEAINFESNARMLQALRDDMKERGVPWRITFGYVTFPRRQYFDVEYSVDGVVTRVTSAGFGRLD